MLILFQFYINIINNLNSINNINNINNITPTKKKNIYYIKMNEYHF